MANGLTMTKEDMDKYFQELAKRKDNRESKITLGKGPKFTTTGTQTASQDIAQGYERIDPSELTPFQLEMMGGEEEVAKGKKAANQLLSSETPSKKPLSITGEKKGEVKVAPKSVTKAKDEEPPPDIYRVMVKGGDPTKDKFYNTKAEADAALEAMGGQGAVAGVRFPAETSEKKSQLMEQYKQQARTGGRKPAVAETEEERITRKISEVNPNATPEQKARFLETLSKSRARGRERGGYAEEYNAALAQGRTPTAYEERVMAEEARDRRMGDFIARNAAKQIASKRDKAVSDEYTYLKKLERAAKRAGQPAIALGANRQIRTLSDMIGANPSNASARRKVFEREAMDDVKREIEARDRLRRERLYKTTTSNPEAKSFDRDLI